MTLFRFASRASNRLSKRLVWLVAGAAALQSLLQALDAELHRDPAGAMLWLAGSVALGSLVGIAERTKVEVTE